MGNASCKVITQGELDHLVTTLTGLKEVLDGMDPYWEAEFSDVSEDYWFSLELIEALRMSK